RRLRSARVLRLHFRQRLFGRRNGTQSVRRPQKSSRQNADGGRMMQTFKALSAILSYPSQDLLDAIDEIGAVIEREALAPQDERRALHALLEEFKGRDLYDLQE